MSTTLIRTLVAVTALSLGTAACSGDDGATETTGSGTGIATLEDDGPQPSDGERSSDSTGADGTDAEAPDDPELAYALYDECMAEYGFDFSTSFGGDGEDGAIDIQESEIELDDPQAQQLDVEDFDEVFDEANAACEQHLANIDDGFDLDPEQQALLEDAQLEWAACMRDAGFDIPDMDSDGVGISIQVGPVDGDPQSGGIDGNDFDFEAFEEAAAGCDSAFDALGETLGDESTEG